MKVLINRMYTGKYLEDNEGNNIGHEVINFFKHDEDNQNYIYIAPYGTFDLNNKDKIQYILLTDAMVGGKYNIIARAEVEECLIYKNKNKFKYILQEPYKENHREQAIKFKFGNKRLYDILKNNSGNDGAIYATFKVKNVQQPKKKITVKLNKNDNNLKHTIIEINGKELKTFLHKKGKDGKTIIPFNIGEKSICYIDEYNDKEEYNFLINNIIMKNDELWEKDKTYSVDTKKVDKNYNTSFNFLKLVEKEYDETIYTNMLRYYFNIKYKGNIIINVFLDWLKDQPESYKIKNIDLKFKEILKEQQVKEILNKKVIKEGRIDLLAIKNDTVLCIENKIKSEINGKKEHGFQLKTYKDIFKEYKFFGLLFVPKYNKEKIKDEEGYKNVEEYYDIIDYETIYNFFKHQLKKEFLEDRNAYKYYDEFLSMLHTHTLDSQANEEYKFKSAIEKIEDKPMYDLFVLKINNSKTKENNKYYVGTTNKPEIRYKELRINHLKDEKKLNYTYKNSGLKFLLRKQFDNLKEVYILEEKLENKINEEILKNKNEDLNEKDIERIYNKILGR